MINEIKRGLERKEKIYIELVDPNGLRDRGSLRESLIQDLLDSGRLQVLDVGIGALDNIVKVGLQSSCRATFIDEEYLVFFELVSESATFDDLVDVVVQASKDGLLEINMLNSEFITASIPGDHDSTFVTGWITKPEAFESSINKVESLYTETFTIEREEDISKVRGGAEIVLANGSTFTATFVTQLSRGWVVDSVLGDLNQTYCLFLLKGATVTQKKD